VKKNSVVFRFFSIDSLVISIIFRTFAFDFELVRIQYGKDNKHQGNGLRVSVSDICLNVQ